MMLVGDPLFLPEMSTILSYCSERRLPSVFSTDEWVIKGGLLSYEPQTKEMYRQTARYVVKILRGAQPRNLPVEQPTRFWFAVNAKSARALGLAIPLSLLQRADQVIE